jgi:hypothetical protein
VARLDDPHDQAAALGDGCVWPALRTIPEANKAHAKAARGAYAAADGRRFPSRITGEDFGDALLIPVCRPSDRQALHAGECNSRGKRRSVTQVTV